MRGLVTGHFAYETFRLLPGQLAYRLLFIYQQDYQSKIKSDV